MTCDILMVCRLAVEEEVHVGWKVKNKSRKLQERQEPTSDKEYARHLRKIPLIPLADGTWEFPPSKINPIYFPTRLGKKVHQDYHYLY